jgi:hypothetical protein
MPSGPVISDTPSSKKQLVEILALAIGPPVSASTRCFGHGGGAPGMNGQLTICDNGYTIVVLANLDPPAAGGIEQFVLARLPVK